MPHITIRRENGEIHTAPSSGGDLMDEARDLVTAAAITFGTRFRVGERVDVGYAHGDTPDPQWVDFLFVESEMLPVCSMCRAWTTDLDGNNLCSDCRA